MREPVTADTDHSEGIPAMRRRALVVEDAAHLREVIAQYLALDGFEVLQAGDGSEALRWLAAQPVEPCAQAWLSRAR